jgi:MraZ protein
MRERTVTTFLSSYNNKVDKKGRVSVPADFRMELAAQSRAMIVVFASPDEGFLYAWGYDDFLKFAERIKKIPAMSPERQRLGRSILAAARPLPMDAEGRIILPEPFLAVASIDEAALFAGMGDYFTIWNPDRYASKQSEDMTHFIRDVESLSHQED